MRLDSLSSSSSDTHGADMRVLRREHLVTAHAARAFAALVVCRLRALFPPQDFCGFNQKKIKRSVFPVDSPGPWISWKTASGPDILRTRTSSDSATSLFVHVFAHKAGRLICLRIPEATWSASGHGCPARSISAPLMITESSLRLVPRTQRGNKRT